jgi:hypothetical protein
MKSQLRFAAGGPPQGTANLSRISEGAALFPGADAIRAGGEHAVSRSFSTGGSTTGGFSIVGPWDESRDIIGTLDLSGYETQFSGLGSSSSLDLAGMDKYMQAAQQQQDGVAFKVRAKRGCATHPRSIAERERRTRISDKLRKLQDLVPNMDKVNHGFLSCTPAQIVPCMLHGLTIVDATANEHFRHVGPRG